MALRVTKTTDKVMFGPVVDWGKKSILVSGGRQYTLEECSKWVNHGKFQDLLAASQRTQDLKSVGEGDKLEFESRGLAENTLDLEFESSWLIIRDGMARQEREVPDNVTVQTQESKDDTHRYKSVGATVAGVPVIELWKTPKAQRIRVVLPSSPDPLTGSYRIQPTTPTPAAKKPRYMGPGGSARPTGVNRRLNFKGEEEEEEAGEEGGEEEEEEEEGEFILEEEGDRMDYQAEIPDTQNDEATFIRTWETANLLSIAQLGDIYLKTRKLTTKQADGVTDLLAAIDKVFDLDLCIQTIDDSGKSTSDV